MIEAFKDHLHTRLSFLAQSKLLVAISGGIDSVVLTHLCYKLNLNIALAHCNFNLRGKESDADEDFVLQYAEDLDLEVFIESFDTTKYAQDNKLSIQLAARELRYDWFDEMAEQLGFDYVLTAHHADDNLETFLINFSRGTGLEGLTGIPEINKYFVRPLLPFSREDIENYTKNNHLKWRDDSSNASTKYIRNKLRHDVIPVLKELNPSLLQSFQNTMSHLNDSADLIEESIDEFLNKAIEDVDSNQIKFKVSVFKDREHPKAYLYEVFKDYGFTAWNDVFGLLDAQSGKQLFSEHWRLIKDRDYLLLSGINSETAQAKTITEKDTKVETPLGMLFFDEVDAILDTSSDIVYVDRDCLEFPLILRKWQEGDVLYPLGMTGKKKLSKYFKDEKFSLLDKERTWLLCSGDNIVWVIGKRADSRFKVTENTRQILKIILR